MKNYGRTDATRLIEIRCDGTGTSGWIILDDRVRWWQVLGCVTNAGYRIHVRASATATFAIAQIIAVNIGRSDIFVGCPDLQIQISNAPANGVYLLACQGDDVAWRSGA